MLVDLKSDNILVGFEDHSVIKDFVRSQASNPMARKIKDGRVIYRSHNEFGPLKSFGILPKIADFGLAQRINDSRRNIHPIQPDHYRAPEVVLGMGWSYSVDIWNLGVLVSTILIFYIYRGLFSWCYRSVICWRIKIYLDRFIQAMEITIAESMLRR